MLRPRSRKWNATDEAIATVSFQPSSKREEYLLAAQSVFLLLFDFVICGIRTNWAEIAHLHADIAESARGQKMCRYSPLNEHDGPRDGSADKTTRRTA